MRLCYEPRLDPYSRTVRIFFPSPLDVFWLMLTSVTRQAFEMVLVLCGTVVETPIVTDDSAPERQEPCDD